MLRTGTQDLDRLCGPGTNKAVGRVPVSFAWSDVGTWDAIWAVSTRNADGNFCQGRVETFATTNSLIRSDGTLTAVVGVNDIVVASPDAVLVTCREKAHMVKDLVVGMRERRHPEVDSHLRMYRPWAGISRPI